jgi:hypothetical protein
VRIPNGATSGVSDSIQAYTPNLQAVLAVPNSWPTMPAVEEIVTRRSERWARVTGSAACRRQPSPDQELSARSSKKLSNVVAMHV